MPDYEVDDENDYGGRTGHMRDGHYHSSENSKPSAWHLPALLTVGAALTLVSISNQLGGCRQIREPEISAEAQKALIEQNQVAER